MDGAYLSALAALAGSSIGAFASFATTWLNQSYQQRVQRLSNEMSRRERIFGEFIDEASKVYGDAMENDLTDTGKLIKLYSIKNRMKLFSGDEVIARAEEVLQMIVKRYSSEKVDFSHFDANKLREADLLFGFTEACRKEIVRY
ncbi:hypothetical protein FZC33_33910 [Labrys sp. KNU-23]|uniref:hypothetical protein n=1 Tax=Labrys sp. KNU-23 TaxID=2789216 RepID=UPI0011EDB901|nr:hypothetical protein [Labrys sp. KNU-23]QEN90989.1 hypothetical protein FZC33_33910 [Labrys sp. KNU-23]